MSNRRAVRVEWTGRGLSFTGGGTDPASPEITLDGDAEAGPSPMLALLLAAAGCTGADVVLILQKMRVQLGSVVVEVEGVRREEDPRRYVSVHFRFLIAGEGLNPAKASRAVELSLEKYCSVIHSLAPDITVSHEIVVA